MVSRVRIPLSPHEGRSVRVWGRVRAARQEIVGKFLLCIVIIIFENQ
jgi:hypothetical protein